MLIFNDDIKNKKPTAGLEPTIPELKVPCLTQLSYVGSIYTSTKL
jgi:hypothetical protein